MIGILRLSFWQGANGLSLDECREAVILKWMLAGDLRPLRAALLRGWVMGRVVQQHLGAMLLDDNEEYCCIDDPTGRRTSHQLIVRQRGPGNPRKPENFVRDIDLVANCMSSEHFGQLAWQFKRMSGSSGLKVQAAIAS